MRDPNKWYSRIEARAWLGIVLVIIGIWTAIILLPTPVLAFATFVLIGGPGIFIVYKIKEARARWMLFVTLLVTSWAYALFSLFAFRNVDNEFWTNFLFPMFSLFGLLTLPLAWFGRYKKSPERSDLVCAFGTYLIFMMAVVPFVFAFAWDYNVRGDSSPPEVVDLKIVAKYIAHHDERPDEPTLQAETLDGRSVFFLTPSENVYDKHNEGDLIEATIHRGALGGMWLEGYG